MFADRKQEKQYFFQCSIIQAFQCGDIHKRIRENVSVDASPFLMETEFSDLVESWSKDNCLLPLMSVTGRDLCHSGESNDTNCVNDGSVPLRAP